VDTRDELVAAFDAGAAAALREMAGVEVVRRGPADAPAGVAVALRLNVGAGWWAVIAFPPATAAALARRVLADVTVEPDDAMTRDCAAEVLNVTAGQAKTLLFGTPHHFTFATPTAPPAGADGPGVGFDSECGPFVLRVFPATTSPGA
jgi:CheY-specific phosphatase CheX